MFPEYALTHHFFNDLTDKEDLFIYLCSITLHIEAKYGKTCCTFHY